MEKWKGKFAVITGASAGIGAEIAKDFLKNGINVIGLARRPELIQQYGETIVGEGYGKIYAHKCDVTSLQSIKDAFKWIEDQFGVIHILVNNAGILKSLKILGDEDCGDKINEVIQTNFNGLVHCSHEAYRLIKKSDDYGFIININSNAGHRIFFPASGMSHNVYHGTKFAVTATSEIMRQELIMQENDKVRVASVSPGVVDTEIFAKAQAASSFYGNVPSIKPEDVANAVSYLLTTPYYVNITELTIKHVSQRF
ncbi:farnesol dehydrogenase-like [Chironomus tepperi]|uniref:farnesol dehydrogenase-like n=1 Tax=Chironomus tepperi TaxID=113505 RepID=UPI00391F861A